MNVLLSISNVSSFGRNFTLGATVILIVHLCGCWNLDVNPLKSDPDLNSTPVIADILQDSLGNIFLQLGLDYSNECDFELNRSTGSEKELTVSWALAGNTCLIDTTIDKENDSVYTYKVQVNKNGYSTYYSDQVSVNYISKIVYSPDSFTCELVPPVGVRLKWKDKSTNESGYYIYSDMKTKSPVNLSANRVSFFDTIGPVTTCKSIQYKLTAQRGKLNSTTQFLQVEYCPVASPANLSITDATARSLTISWIDMSSNENNFQIQRSINGGLFDSIATVNANTTVFTEDLNILGICSLPVDSIAYRVRAMANGLPSKYSNIVMLQAPVCGNKPAEYLKSVAITLKLVDFSMTDGEKQAPIIDIKVRNAGNDICFIKSIEFHVLNVYSLLKGSKCLSSHVPVSSNYDIRLFYSDSAYIQETNISQVVKSNDVDRFTLTLSGNEGSAFYVFHMFLVLFYNEVSTPLVTDTILFFMPGVYSDEISSIHSVSEDRCYDFDIINKNRENAMEIMRLTADRTQLVDSIVHTVMNTGPADSLMLVDP